MKLTWTSEQYGIAATQAPLPDGARLILFRRTTSKRTPDWHWWVKMADLIQALRLDQ